MTSPTITYAAKKPSVFQLTSGEYQPYTSETRPIMGSTIEFLWPRLRTLALKLKLSFTNRPEP